MVAELQKPAKEKLQKQIEANFEWATEKLMSIASAEFNLGNIKASDKIRAIEVLAKMHGWNAPEKSKGDVEKFERIEVVIVNHSPTRSSTDLQTAAEASLLSSGIRWPCGQCLLMAQSGHALVHCKCRFRG